MHWAEARQAARDTVKPLEAVELPPAGALGMALASPVRALVALPGYDNSAVLPVEHSVHKGHRVSGSVADGKHVRRRGEDRPDHDRPASLWGAAPADALAVLPPERDGGEAELLPLPC
jgi:molybdopterin molybdotransferase